MRMNAASIIYDGNKGLIFSQDWIKLCSYENIQTCVEGKLKHNRI